MLLSVFAILHSPPLPLDCHEGTCVVKEQEVSVFTSHEHLVVVQPGVTLGFRGLPAGSLLKSAPRAPNMGAANRQSNKG